MNVDLAVEHVSFLHPWDTVSMSIVHVSISWDIDRFNNQAFRQLRFSNHAEKKHMV